MNEAIALLITQQIDIQAMRSKLATLHREGKLSEDIYDRIDNKFIDTLFVLNTAIHELREHLNELQNGL